ncbi:MAG TPA: DUF1080 domain-containing protein [Candidatus Limnocylindria bacterium]|jgi:hypothetical protein|nr:DUF1080 domain-containing protein [Candidatus Limnocylindria bacterium]
MKSLLLLPCLATGLTMAVQGASVSLFDGKSFAGWDGDTNKIWHIDQGEIVGGDGKSKVPQNEFLATIASYTNFVIRLKFKLTGSEGFVNSGVQFRSQRVPNNSEMNGYQADIGEGWYGCIYDESRRNKVMARPTDDAVKKAVKVGEWNDYEVRAEGRHMVTKMNGVVLVDYTEADESIPQFGRFGLQIHGGGVTEVRFKSIMLETLP